MGCRPLCPKKHVDPATLSTGEGKLSTGARGFGLPSAEAQRMSASVGSSVFTVLEVLADLSGAIGDKVRTEMPDSDPVRRI